MRVSDADRDRAVSELSTAFQAGRLTVEEFNQRSSQALSARAGKELTALFADLPLDDAPVPKTGEGAPVLQAGEVERRGAAGVIAARVAMGAAAAAAVSLGFLALANALSTPSPASAPSPTGLKTAKEILAGLGINVRLPSHVPTPPPAAGFDWAGTITPAIIALLLIAAIVIVHAARLDRRMTRVNRA
jgi:hypothetical protein